MPTRERRAKILGLPLDQLPDGRGRHHNHTRGASHPRWSEDHIISEHGYLKVRVGKDHPLADPNGYAYEHLGVWAAAGRPLPGPDELLHHRDEDKTNNRLGNLELITRSEHAAHHNADRRRDEQGRFLPKAAGALASCPLIEPPRSKTKGGTEMRVTIEGTLEQVCEVMKISPKQARVPTAKLKIIRRAFDLIRYSDPEMATHFARGMSGKGSSIDELLEEAENVIQKSGVQPSGRGT